MTELNLWLDYYDDIYSDFDSRHYLKRRISDDFLHELRTAVKYKTGHMNDLVLLLPVEKRDETTEQLITNSLKNFFQLRHKEENDAMHRKLQQGLLLLVVGILLILLNAYIAHSNAKNFLITAVKVLIEPASWFTIWSGFDFLFYDVKMLKKERNFFKQLDEMGIHFRAA
jgi:hypothetical protein